MTQSSGRPRASPGAHKDKAPEVRRAPQGAGTGTDYTPMIAHPRPPVKCQSEPITADEFDPTLKAHLDRVRDRFWACDELGDYTGAHRARLEYRRIYRLCIHNALIARKRQAPIPPRLPCQDIWQRWTVDHLEAPV